MHRSNTISSPKDYLFSITTLPIDQCKWGPESSKTLQNILCDARTLQNPICIWLVGKVDANFFLDKDGGIQKLGTMRIRPLNKAILSDAQTIVDHFSVNNPDST
jgi:hypothetical protein